MASVSLAPSAGSVGPKSKKGSKSRKGRKSAPRSAGLWASIKRMTSSGKAGQVSKAAMASGEVIVPMLLASGLEGFRETQGKSMKIGTGKFAVDYRTVLGLGALAAGLWKPTTNPHLVAVGTGILASTLHGTAYDFGSKWARPKDQAALATVPAAAPATGIIVGKVHDLDTRIQKLHEKYEKAMAKGHTRRAARLFGRVQRLRALARMKGQKGGGRGQGVQHAIKEQMAYDD